MTIEAGSRRSFLRLCTAGAAVCGIGSACTNPNDPTAPFEPATFGDVTAGKVADFPEGTLVQVPASPAFLGRDAGGFYALTSTCTHAGCGVFVRGSGASASLECPCHGSRFDRSGAVLGGPAAAPLVHFAVEIMAGDVIVHGGVRVDAATRTPAA
jgi:cytochrome b6-f complex iron-sulfur subunit